MGITRCKDTVKMLGATKPIVAGILPRLGSRLSTKWGTYSVNSLKCMQAACIRQHADGTVHRVAQNLFLSPDKAISELLPYDLHSQDLFRGNVPQARDWLRAWSACLSPIAFTNAEKHYETEDFASGRRCSVSRRGFSTQDFSCCFWGAPCHCSLNLVFPLPFRLGPDDSGHALGGPVAEKEIIAERSERVSFCG